MMRARVGYVALVLALLSSTLAAPLAPAGPWLHEDVLWATEWGALTVFEEARTEYCAGPFKAEAWPYRCPRGSSWGAAVPHMADIVAVTDDHVSIAAGSTTGGPSGYDVAVTALGPDGAMRWSATFDGPPHGEDWANALVLSPDGAVAYIAGAARPAGWRDWDVGDAFVLAINVATGERLWQATYDHGGGGQDRGDAIALSPDGSTVVVALRSRGDTAAYSSDFVTWALDAATGEQLWASRYAHPGAADEWTERIFVAPDGDTVFTVGTSAYQFAVVAHDARTGAETWTTRTERLTAYVVDAVMTPDGSTLVAAGQFQTGDPSRGAVLQAFDLRTGALGWNQVYAPTNSEVVGALAMAPSGDRFYVLGGHWASEQGGTHMFTLAYRTSDGALLWDTKFHEPLDGNEMGRAIGVRPDGSAVLVAGESLKRAKPWGFDVVAYDASDGRELWWDRQDTHGWNPSEISFTPDGGQARIAAWSAPQSAVVAYDLS